MLPVPVDDTILYRNISSTHLSSLYLPIFYSPHFYDLLGTGHKVCEGVGVYFLKTDFLLLPPPPPYTPPHILNDQFLNDF